MTLPMLPDLKIKHTVLTLNTKNSEERVMAENYPTSQNTLKKTLLATAFTTALGVSATALADQVSGTFSGVFTLLAPNNAIATNSDASLNIYGGLRTETSGTFTYDIATGLGGMIIEPFFWIASSILENCDAHYFA